MRAGKDLLKDRWNIRILADLFERYGDLIREACEVIRYTDPDGDTNCARWPNCQSQSKKGPDRGVKRGHCV